MSSRGSIAQRQRNSNIKVNRTVIEHRKCLVVKIDWTQAPVITTTVRSTFKLFVVAMDTETWTPIQRGPMVLSAGTKVCFVVSSDHPGYYYVVIVGESCTCTAGLYKKACHHQQVAATGVYSKPKPEIVCGYWTLEVA